MALPTLLAEDAPHFLRSVGVLPVVVFLPALGLDWLADVIKPKVPNHKSQIDHGPLVVGRVLLLALPLLFGLVSTAWAYFGDYARDPMTGYWFERGAAALAGRINGFLGTGWDGERMLHGGTGDPPTALPADRRVYLDPGMWEEWPQVRSLIAAPEAVTIGLEKEEEESLNGATAVFIWPYGDWQRAWALLPAPAEVTVEEGPLSQGDRDPEPYTTYLAFFATPPDPATPALARFSGGIELLGVAVTPAGPDRWRVRLRWRATAPLADDYTVFLHYLRNGERIAQADSKPCGGRYSTMIWHRGDVVNDDHYVEGIGAPLPGQDGIRLGLWQPESGAVRYLLDEAGNPAGDWIDVPVDG
jgi:hypothetical protein